ncbi:MAG: hydroxymethylglutaryl-CoA lyase [Sphingobacteriales bacterium]|nr:hydroxymethylglutaryl-CoA lyase [Sphingobacteriales bacterium]OJY90995.1 MAG: hydroxymethylglutaryl-CoA lyase [Sphingobacteriales bacterium 44-15]
MQKLKEKLKIIECPRDAMQGWPHFIPTEKKVEYLNSLLKVGFDTIDFGSFVSPKAIPQMADTHEVIQRLDVTGTATKLLAIVANERGALEASAYEAITYLGYPFSVSETFQQRNTNSSIAVAVDTVKKIQEICTRHGKKLVLYISMGFGNPYGDPYDETIVYEWVEKMQQLGIRIISLADTVGVATPEQVADMTAYVIEHFPGIETGVHLHSTPLNRIFKIEAAYKAGCRRFDGALMGIGGCPMANDDLVGNMDTVQMLHFFSKLDEQPEVNEAALQHSLQLAATTFI